MKLFVASNKKKESSFFLLLFLHGSMDTEGELGSRPGRRAVEEKKTCLRMLCVSKELKALFSWKFFLQYLSIFKHMHGTLNVVKKITSFTV